MLLTPEIERGTLPVMEGAQQTMFEYVLQEIDRHTGDLPKVCREADVGYFAVMQIKRRVTKNPGVVTIQKLADYFKAREAAT